ncbi:MAG: 3'(2'),5'-bisphosphate nucleotidase CysQ [Desulfobacterales bacterium]
MSFIIDPYLVAAANAAVEAGKAILEIYRSDFTVHRKADRSPLTQADRLSHDIIVRSLRPFHIPLLSEEGKSFSYRVRRKWHRLWIVDPLDGTKEFVNRNGEFTVNIALVEHHTPIMGVVYIPIRDLLFFGFQSTGSFKRVDADAFLRSARLSPFSGKAVDALLKTASRLPLEKTGSDAFTIVGSRSHASAELESFVQTIKRQKEKVTFISAGSSMKFCLVAEGSADIYPRFGPTMEWDTAAGQAIAENAGMCVLDRNTQKPLVYNKENLLNPWFIVQSERMKGTFSFD